MENEPTIAESVGQFVAYVKATQSHGSARTYGSGLRRLLEYLAAQNPPIVQVVQLTPQIVADFIPWLYEYLLQGVAGGDPEKVKEATRQNYLFALSRFCEWLIIETRRLPWTVEQYDVLRRAVRRASKRHTPEHLPPNKLPSQEIIDTIRAAAHEPLHLAEDAALGEVERQGLARLRNIAMIEALISSGMRVGELVRLERGDLLHDIKGAYIRHAKGGKEREVLFDSEAWGAIMAYLSARGDAGRALTRLPIFARHDRGAGKKTLPLTTRSVQNVICDLAADSGILARFHLTPHSFRHFFATEFLSESGDLSLTQYALGHSWPTTTRIYAQTKVEDYRRAYRKIHK